MLFNSSPFLILMMVTLVLYYQKWMYSFQKYLLILSSFVFYAYGQPKLLLLLFLSASTNAVISYLLESEKSYYLRRIYAVVGVGFNLLILFFFKYIGLFSELIAGGLVNGVGYFLVNIPLPIGISFYSFQGISLVIDAFRDSDRKNKVLLQGCFRDHFFNTVLFITFFPQLVAGPIVKAYYFFPQIKIKHAQDVRWDLAIKTLILGYFFKMFVADNLSMQTFWMTFPYFETYSTMTLLMLLFGYSIQIFSDFAGYSFIAIGVAKCFGYDLPQNFNFPYLAKSFSEFWSRWHISLSSWLREYLYYPLGGNRNGEWPTYRNLIIVMVLGGMWHGAEWSYLFWGGYHGFLLAFERYVFATPRFNVHKFFFAKILRVVLIFCFVTFGWLFFIFPDIQHVSSYIKCILFNIEGWRRTEIIILITMYSMPMVLYYLNHVIKEKISINAMDRSFFYGVMLFMIATNSGKSGEFIYFQF